MRSAHPRACGENTARRASSAAFSGSSPRMRGKRSRRKQSPRRNRLIPAHAGKTLPRPPIRDRHQAHPRACGENKTGPGSVWQRPGSSPRMRGKLSGGGCPRLARGAHPRACGENYRLSARRSRWVGSSPRMRGKPLLSINQTQYPGLIPAHAGGKLNRLSSPESASGLIPAHAGKTLVSKL